MSRWFRHYAGLARDDKLVRAAMKCKQPIERVVWVWCAILESAAELNDGGKYELDHAECAYFLRASEDELAAVEDALRACGRLSEGIVARWDDRQFQSDRSAERTRRYRDRQKTSRDGGESTTQDDVTSRDDECDVTVTHHRQRTETETDIEPIAIAIGLAPEPDQTPRQRLWSEGVPILVSLGVSEKQSRSCIGLWLKDCGEDDLRVLGAIQRARDDAVIEPIAWITSGFQKIKAKANARTDKRDEWLTALEGEPARADFIDGDFEVVGTAERPRLAARRHG